MTKQNDTTCQTYHRPVLLKESIDGLAVKADGVYVDVTFGGGGHSRELLSRLGDNGRLFSFDQDEDAAKNAFDDKRFTFVRSNFRYLRNWMRYYQVEAIDGLIADLGVSSHHFDDIERGFSLRGDAPLDMRMNQKQELTAADVVNTYSEEQLQSVLKLYGELQNAKRIAAALVARRATAPIKTTADLMSIAAPLFPREREKKEMTKLFQALRIETNGEMEALAEMLLEAIALLAPEGRIAVITYHSLEDRIVKNVIRSGNIQGQVSKDFYGNPQCPLTAVNNKVITPSEEEVRENPRARSAKLRIAARLQ